MSDKIRLDLLVVERQLVPSRSRARDLVKRGEVSVDNRVVTKAGALIDQHASITINKTACPYVSRAGLKLLEGLRAFKLDPKGRIALDLGASTGGFTQVLLEHGASRVYAIDVGRDQLHGSLRWDERVVSLEGQNARDLSIELVPEPIGAITADLSFVSLRKVLETPLLLAAPNCWLIALIKPQFEVGPENIGKGGIVRNKTAVDLAVEAVDKWITAKDGWQTIGIIDSPIKGLHGNHEYLIAASYAQPA